MQISEEAAKATEANVEKSWLKTFYAAREDFAKKYGTIFAFIFYHQQQLVLNSRHDLGKGRGLWYWNLEVVQGLWQGASMAVELEVDKNKGVDKFLPTFALFSSNTGENASLYIPELYFQQNLSKDRIYLVAGKLDLSDWFDTNAVANSADTQFSSDALVSNGTIFFPRKGIGAMARLDPFDWVYIASGAATAKSTSTQTGLSNAFNSAFFISEFGVSPRFGSHRGNYRFIFHLTHRTLERINDEGTKNTHVGYAISFDQEITKRVIIFLRYGITDRKVRDIVSFWSTGGAITEPIPGRTFDCLGIGVARSFTGDDYRAVNEPDAGRVETMYEAYYSWRLNEAVTLTPNAQIVINPNADKTAGIEVVCGFRFLLCF